MEDRFLPRVWTGKEYYYPVFSELGITYENPNKEFSEENIKSFNWVFGWHFGICVQNGDKIEYIRNPSGDIEFDYTLEMPTGLKDKNGKLIYEGDILGNEKLMSDVGVIKYEDETCRYIFERHCVNECFNKWWADNLIVIGNIHENPKLLEKNNEF